MSLDRVSERLDELIRKIGPKVADDISLTNVLAALSELRTALQSGDPEAIKRALQDREKLRQIQEVLRVLAQKQKYPTYIDDFLDLHPNLKYPMKIPQTLFESERVKKVIVKIPQGSTRQEGTDEVSIDEMMSMLFPGLLTFRYGNLAKVPVGAWSSLRYRVNPAGVSVLTDESEAFEIKKSQMPATYLTPDPSAKVYVPQELHLRLVEKQDLRREEEVEEEETADADAITFVRFCTRCGAVRDGDESCNCGNRFLVYASPPKAYSLLWNVIELREGRNTIVDPLFKGVFDVVLFSTLTDVKKILYGFERRYKSSTWRVNYEKLFGDSFTTDGLQFKISESIVQKLLAEVRTNQPTLLRDMHLLYLVYVLDNVAGEKFGLTFTQSITIAKSILLDGYATSNRIPISPDGLNLEIERLVDRPTEFKNALERLQSMNETNMPLRDQDIENLASVQLRNVLERLRDEDGFKSFIRDIFIHSLKHYLTTSSMILLGIDDKDMRSHFSRGSNDVFLYDNLPEGNGCSETLERLVKIPISERTRVLRQAVEKDIPVALPSRDFYTILEEFLANCKANRADQIYFKLVTNAKTTKLVEQCGTSDLTRQNLLQTLKRDYSLDDFTISHLDALLRYPSHHTILKSVPEDELFYFKLLPEALLLRLSPDEKKRISPDVTAVNLNKSILGKMQDTLEMCVDGCPVCLYTGFCELSIFNMRFFLSRRLLETAYRLVRDETLLRVGSNQKEKLLDKALAMLEARGVLYLQAFDNEFQDLLEIAYELLGQPVSEGRAFVKALSFDTSEKFMLKMEVG